MCDEECAFPQKCLTRTPMMWCLFESGFRRVISEAITPSCVQPPLDGVGGHVEEDVPEVGHHDEVLPD